MVSAQCRGCKTELAHVVIDLGHCPPSNSFLTSDQLNEPEKHYPLKVHVCEACSLVQVRQEKSHEEIFDAHYPYFSSISQAWLAHSKKFAEMAKARFDLGQNSSVIEVASNDGYLLQYFQQMGIPVLGIDPSVETANVARSKGIETRAEFFGQELASRLVKQGKRADLVIGNNVLAHVPDLHGFVGGLETILSDKGVVTLEFPHVRNLVDEGQFDTIYHEHLSYFSLGALQPIFDTHGLVVTDVEKLPTHGGSLRVYARRKGDTTEPVSERVAALLAEEESAGMRGVDYYKRLQDRATEIKHGLVAGLMDIKRQGKRICGYGAAAKGNTLLNYCGIGKDVVEFVADVTPAKQGKHLPGNHIPVLHESALRVTRPDYILVLPWNHRVEIAKRLDYTRDWGAKLVVPVPKFEVISNGRSYK